MARACHYAVWGFADAVPAVTPMKMEHLRRSGKTAAVQNIERLEKIMGAAAGLTGMSYLDLLSRTPSRLNAMVVSAQIEAGATVSRDMAKAQVDYTCTLDEIRNRLLKERGDGK